MSHTKSISDWIEGLPWSRIALAGLLVCIVSVVIAYKDDQNIYVIASLVGSIASLTALVIALIQIMSIERSSEATRRISEETKRISEETNKAVEETKDRIIHAISLSDVAAAVKLIEVVQGYASRHQHELTHLRLGDIQSLLIKFNADGDLDRIKKCQPLLDEVDKHILILYKDFSDPKKKKMFKPGDLNETLLHLKKILEEYHHRLFLLSTIRDESGRKAFDLPPES